MVSKHGRNDDMVFPYIPVRPSTGFECTLKDAHSIFPFFFAEQSLTAADEPIHVLVTAVKRQQLVTPPLHLRLIFSRRLRDIGEVGVRFAQRTHELLTLW
jgi:hypothetical protein